MTETFVMQHTTGALAAAAWLIARKITPPPGRWYVEIAFEDPAATFRIEIYAEEWGYFFSHGDQMSWIRVTDIAFVHGRDDHELLRRTPRLETIGTLLRGLEDHHKLAFRRDDAILRTNLTDAESNIRRWIATL